MKRKSLIVILVFVVFSAFANAASAGILGGILGGLINSPAKPHKTSLEELEAFHKKYLDNVAEKIRKTGDIDGAFNDVLIEQKNFGYNARVMTNTSEIKDAEFSGRDLPVIVKAVVNTKEQIITISYLNQQDGSFVGSKLTKHYDLPVNSATQISSQPQQASTKQTTTTHPFASASINSSLQKDLNQKPFILEENSVNYQRKMNNVYILNGRTGCSSFDSLKISGSILLDYVLDAFQDARTDTTTRSILERMAENTAKERHNPFMASKIKDAAKDLTNYYKRNDANINLYEIHDYITADINKVININTEDMLYTNCYNLKRGIYAVSPFFSGYLMTNVTYYLTISESKMKWVYETLDNIFKANKVVMDKFNRDYKNNFSRQKITIVRVCYANDVMCDMSSRRYATFKNAHFVIKTLDGYISRVNGRTVYSFDNYQWNDLLSCSQPDCVAK